MLPPTLKSRLDCGVPGEGDPGDAGPCRHGEAHVDRARTRSELHLVATRGRRLVLVREGLAGRLGGRAHGTQRGQNRHVLVRRAAGAAEVGEAEARDRWCR